MQAATLDELAGNLLEFGKLCLEDLPGEAVDLPRFVGIQQVEVAI